MFKTKLYTVKIFIFFGIMLVGNTCYADLIPANLYQCSNKNITVNYSSSSLTGEPILNISIGKRAYAATGNNIQLQKTVLGNLVGMVKTSVPDLYTNTMTVLLPDVNVTTLGESINFKSKFLITHAIDSIGGAQLVNGVIQNNSVITLECSATAVVF